MTTVKTLNATLPSLPLAEGALAFVGRQAEIFSQRDDANLAKSTAEMKYQDIIIRSGELRKELIDSKEALRLANVAAKESYAEGASVAKALNARHDELNLKIPECEDIIDDILHYMELRALTGGQAGRLTKVLRQTLKTKRSLQDERSLVLGAICDLRGPSEDPRYKDGSYAYHLNRVNNNRRYRPKRVTLEQLLNPEVEAVQPTVSAPTNKFARFAHMKSK